MSTLIKKDKEFFVSQVGVIIILMVLTGCGHRAVTNEGKIHIRWGADKNPIRQEQIAIFEKENPDIKVDLNWGSYTIERLLTQIAGGRPPDIFMVYDHGNFTELCKKGVLDDFWSGSDIWIGYEGGVYGLPEVISPDVMFYNKRLFRDMGIDFPSKDWTWDTLSESARKLTQKDKSGRYTCFGLLMGNVLLIL